MIYAIRWTARKMPPWLLLSWVGQQYVYRVVYRFWCPGSDLTVRECIRRGECGCNNSNSN